MPEFHEWLTRNHDKLLTYNAQEIYDLALACGFSRIDLAQWLTNVKFNNRAA